MDNLSYIVNVEAAIYKGDKWLIIKRSEKEEHAPGLLSMVGGKVETNIAEENVLENTLIREIMEEVGVKISEKMIYVESKAFVTDKEEVVVDMVFLCKYESGEAKPMSLDEVSEVYWMSTSDILENKNSPIWLKESIEKCDSMKKVINKEF
jgi:8-oxo-dGTP diphosphatase